MAFPNSFNLHLASWYNLNTTSSSDQSNAMKITSIYGSTVYGFRYSDLNGNVVIENRFESQTLEDFNSLSVVKPPQWATSGGSPYSILKSSDATYTSADISSSTLG